MKKYITAPIGSGIIIPGFGQILNGQIRKGLILMGVVFVIFVACVFELLQIVMGIVPQLSFGEINSQEILARIDVMDFSMLRVIIILFLLVWIYSIIDAFVVGLKVEKERNGN